ncbi:hypothetical protein BDZ88DRAFT_398360, partial [Geranomyces variabilis]
CRFYALGTCQKKDCPFAHDRKTTEKPVCSYYRQGNCRFGAYCALAHVKQPAAKAGVTSSGARSSTGKLVADVAPNRVLTSTGRTYIPASEALARATSVVKIPQPPPPPPPTAPAGLPEEAFTSAPTPALTAAKTSAGSAEGGGSAGGPLCPFAMQGNCRFGERCRYRHGLACPVCGKQCLDPDSDPQVHAEHIERCHERQEREARYDAQVAESADVDCVVCMETVKSKADPRFGLLDCEHCVCLNCIRQWRTNERMDTSKSCPICRTVTHFVTPSAIWPTDAETKSEIVDAYKKKLGTIDCKHYNRGEGSCPFGTSCFYRHVGRDGVPEEISLRKVMGNDAESLTIVSAVKLADFLDAYEGRA